MSIKGLLNQTITLYNLGSYDADGEPSYSTGSDIDCRFEAKTKRVLLPDGQVLTIDAFVIVGPDESVSTDDKVTYGSNDYKVVDIFEVPGASGSTNHKELRLVKWPT